MPYAVGKAVDLSEGDGAPRVTRGGSGESETFACFCDKSCAGDCDVPPGGPRCSRTLRPMSWSVEGDVGEAMGARNISA